VQLREGTDLKTTYRTIFRKVQHADHVGFGQERRSRSSLQSSANQLRPRCNRERWPTRRGSCQHQRVNSTIQIAPTLTVGLQNRGFCRRLVTTRAAIYSPRYRQQRR